MRLYHGTSEADAKAIIRSGLRPRADRPSHWSVESRADLVYLTNAYAPYFACNASGEDERWAVVEVEVDEADLLPDEDWLEQATRGRSAPCRLRKMEARTAWYRKRLEGFRHHALDSLEGLGNAAHPGVPPEGVTRVVLFDPKLNRMFAWMALDPSISILNYRFMGDKYRGLTRAFAGYSVTVDEVLGQVGRLGLPESQLEAVQEALDALPDALEILKEV